MNLTTSIIPKSDQLNADDLIAGPRTIKITAVESGSAEQPVVIQYEGGKGRPYKPNKSMRRVFIALWGAEGDVYVGRSITLYRDPTVEYGGDPQGGIKISHMSNIPEAVTILLTVRRGKRKPHRVMPLVVEPEPQPEQPAKTAVEPSFDIQALTDVGDTKAREGNEALAAWWATIPNRAKHALKAKLVEWKTIAGSVSPHTEAA